MRFALGVLVFSLFASVGCGSSDDDNTVSDSVLMPGVDDMADQSIGSGPGAPADEMRVETKPSPDIQATDMEQSAADVMDPTVDAPSAEPTTPPPEMDGPADVPSAEPMDANGPDETMEMNNHRRMTGCPKTMPIAPNTLWVRQTLWRVELAHLDEPVGWRSSNRRIRKRRDRCFAVPQPETRFSFTPRGRLWFCNLRSPRLGDYNCGLFSF